MIPFFFLILLSAVCATLLCLETQRISAVQFHDPVQKTDLSPYYDSSNDIYYLILPAYLPPEEVQVSCPWYSELTFSSEEESYATLADLPLGQTVTMSHRFPWGQVNTYDFRLLRCSARYTIHLGAQDNVMDRVHADQANEEGVSVSFLEESGNPAYEGHGVLSGRGNSTWLLSKKPYNLHLSQPVDIGPFDHLEKLCLLAEATDPSRMRNALAYHTGQALDIPYASPYAYADVFINGCYQGLYGMTTKEAYSRQLSSDRIQAVFELSTSGKGDILYTDTGKALRVYYGSRDDITYYMETMERALWAQDWETLFHVIDLDSWAKKYALDELLYNVDLSLTSQYFYLGQDLKIHCMLPWDYDVTLTAWMYPFGDPQDEALAAYWNRGKAGRMENWFELLLESPQFRQAVLRAFQENFPPERLAEVADTLSRCASELSGSWYCDQALWNSSYAANHPPEAGAPVLEGYQQELNTYLNQRLLYLLDVFSQWENYRLVSFSYRYTDQTKGTRLQLLLPKGTDLQPYRERILNSTKSWDGLTFQGWFTDTGIPLEDLTTLEENLSLVGIFDGPLPDESS